MLRSEAFAPRRSLRSHYDCQAAAVITPCGQLQQDGVQVHYFIVMGRINRPLVSSTKLTRHRDWLLTGFIFPPLVIFVLVGSDNAIGFPVFFLSASPPDELSSHIAIQVSVGDHHIQGLILIN